MENIYVDRKTAYKTLKVNLFADGTYEIAENSDKSLIFDGEIKSLAVEANLPAEYASGYGLCCVVQTGEGKPRQFEMNGNIILLEKLSKGALNLGFCALKQTAERKITEYVKWQGIKCTVN